MSALLPCPFCGGTARRCDVPADIDDDNAGASYIECSKCQACTALHFDRKENLERSWNDRAGTSVLHIEAARAEARREALEAEMPRLRKEAKMHIVNLEQCAIIVATDCGENLAKTMTDAAAFLRALLGDKGEEG